MKYKEQRLQKNAELRRTINVLIAEGDFFLKQNLGNLEISDYRYDINEAMNELCLDEEVIFQLIEDYIIQILKSKIAFYKYIHELKKDELQSRVLDYTNIRDLAHKNLGVVRNLRIKDAQIILKEIMEKDDLDYLRLCVKALEISAVKLNPLCAYETLKLIEVKNSL